MASVSRAASKFGETVGLTGAPTFREGRNVIDLIIEDHAQARQLYENYKTATNLEQKKVLRNSIIKALVQHDECEQLLVYPLLREKVGGELGEDEYRRSLAEHQELRELLYNVRYLDIKKNPHQFEFKFKNAMDAVIRHIEVEEAEVLPLLREHVSEENLKKVGASFEAHKPTSATRPHPSAPMQGYPAAVANVILKPFDLIQDYWEGVD